MNQNYMINELIKFLSATPEFMQLKSAREVLAKNPKANSLVSQFQKKQESLYSGGLSQTQAQYLSDELSRDYEQLNAYPEIKNYFETSERFSTLLNGFMQSLNSSLAKELG